MIFPCKISALFQMQYVMNSIGFGHGTGRLFNLMIQQVSLFPHSVQSATSLEAAGCFTGFFKAFIKSYTTLR